LTDDKQSLNRGRAVRIAIQIIGFVAGIAAIGWCLKTALKQENREQFAKLADAPAELIALMLGLSLLTLALNGVAFWVAIRPVKRIPLPDVLATNGLCTFLGYLPFKAGAIVRFAIHNRRDKVPVATIGAWFGSLAVVMLLSFAVMTGAAIGRGRIDPIWFALAVGLALASGGVLIAVARAFRGEPGLQRLERLVGLTRIAALKRPLRWNIWLQLHAGFDMLSSPGAVLGGMANRMLDSAVQAARFVVAAKILKLTSFPIEDFTLQQALMVSLMYFIVGVVSPSGLAGLREGAVGAWAAPLLAMAGMHSADDERTFIALGLLVSATEFFAFVLGAGLGLAWLRPDRLLKLRGGGGENHRAAEAPKGESVEP
jgi:hypothetical protein